MVNHRICYICGLQFTCSGNCPDKDNLSKENYIARLEKLEVCSCLSCVLDLGKNDSEAVKKMVSLTNKNFCLRTHTNPSYR